MNLRYTALSLITAATTQLTAQYCTPTFANGCTLWSNQQITIGTINWSLGGSDCLVSDYTPQSTVVIPGVAVPMTVVSGNWTGCAVWVDLNNNMAFEDSENLYYSYVGGDPSYTYNFTITLPMGTSAGPYRMRVVAPWGSDGFLDTNVNGYGACGNYQYGNFDDFTVVVSSTGIAPVAERGSDLLVAPNPFNDVITVQHTSGETLQRIVVLTMDGRVVKELVPETPSDRTNVDLGGLASGPYVVQACTRTWMTALPVIKR